MDIYTLRGLSFSYPEQSHKALDGINLSIREGEFITLAGPSGSGKSTLLRQLKTTMAPHGSLKGDILFSGRPLSTVDLREQSTGIGFVQQNPDNQLVTDKVWHELAFGLESLGYSTPVIRGRVAEMCSFFGIQSWFYKNVTELSGGQKQLLNLASIMAMQPTVLILDEPTSQLDPIAAADFLATVGKIARELGTTVLMTEHRLEEAFPMSDRVLVMAEGRILCDGTPAEVGESLRVHGHSMFSALPTPMRIFASVTSRHKCPVTVGEGRQWLNAQAQDIPLDTAPALTPEKLYSDTDAVITLEDVWFKYEKDQPDVLRGLSLKACRGELLAILGGNGTGKTTMLSVISGVNRAYRGQVLIEGQALEGLQNRFHRLLGVLPQNPQALFVKKTLREDLQELLQDPRYSERDKEGRLAWVVRLCRLETLLERHPYDLSGGEQQRAALAKVLLLDPKILLLDEPTKGLDAEFKLVFAEILQTLLRRGITIIMVSHDIEFCAKHAHRCALFFDGAIVTEGAPRPFFSGNSFYTTAANRMARHLLPQAVTAEDVMRACGGTVPSPPELLEDDRPLPEAEIPPTADALHRLPRWRRLLAAAAGALLLFLCYLAFTEPDIPWLMDRNKLGLYSVLFSAAVVLAAATTRRCAPSIANDQVPVWQRQLSRRTVAAAAMILLAVPLTVFVGVYWLGDRKYYFISLLILLETMLPFFLLFEDRRPQARELVVISSLCAMAVAGRAAFFMLPQFKPVAALVIIAGVAFGGESGFLVGAVAMLVSNILFGQGPWTPWQMFAMGIIGFLAGVLFQKGVLRCSRVPLCIFGGLATLVVYGGIMNPSFVIMYNDHPTWGMFFAAYLTGFPFDLVHATATVIFLWFLSRPMLEKLDRIKVKYGLVEKKSALPVPEQHNEELSA